MSVRDRLRTIFGWRSGQAPRLPKLGDPSELSNQDSLVDSYNKALQIPETRRDLYDIYDDADEGEVAAILDSFSEDSCQYDIEHKCRIWVTSKDKKTKQVLRNLKKRLGLDGDCGAIIRDMCKYGDDFFKLNIKELPPEDTIKGPAGPEPFRRIDGWYPYDPRHVDRLETQEGVLIGYNVNPTTPEAQALRQPRDPNNPQPDAQPWDVVHFRLMKRKFYRWQNQRFRNIYGTSILYPAIRAARQLKIMDDMLMLHRILRSLDRHIYYIETGHASREDEIRTLKQWKIALKRKQWIDPSGARMAARFDPMTFLEDIFWPTRAGSSSKVETLPGQPNVADIVDHKRFVNRFYGTIRAPKSFFGHEDDQHALVPKNTMSHQDVVYGRRCNDIQAHFLNELVRLAQIELALRNMDPDPDGFEWIMVRPSTLEEEERVEVMVQKTNAAKDLIEFGDTAHLNMERWIKHVLRKVMGMTSLEVAKYTEGMKERLNAGSGNEMGSGPPDQTPPGTPKDDDDGEDDRSHEPPKGGQPLHNESVAIEEVERRIQSVLRKRGKADVSVLYEFRPDHGVAEAHPDEADDGGDDGDGA